MKNVQPYTDEELLILLSRGDKVAFRAIYDRYQKKIASFAYLLTESETTTDEIVQEIFVKLWENRQKLKDVKKFNSWLHMVIRNHVVDRIRKTAREAAVREYWSKKINIDANFVDNIIYAKEHEKLLFEAITKLTPQQQEVYRLSREHGLKHDEIAIRLGITAPTVKNHLVNALKSIREYFRHHADIMIIALYLFRNL